MAITRLGQLGVGLAAYPAFNPKDPSTGAGPHDPGVITRLAQFGIGAAKYGIFEPKGEAPVVTPPTGQESTGAGIGLAAARPPVDFVMNGGYLAGVRVPRFTTKNRMIKQVPDHWRKQPEDVELREMMGIYAMWKRS